MTKFLKFAVLAAVLCTSVLLSSGCKPKRGTASPEDYFPLILVAFDGGKTAAMIGRNEAIKAEDFAGCVSTEVLISAFDSAGDALAGKLNDELVIPGFDLNLDECLALHPDGEPPKGNPDVAPLVEGLAGVALGTGRFYAQKLQSANCKKGTAALAAVEYIEGLVPAIAGQISEPGSPVHIDGVSVSLASCDE